MKWKWITTTIALALALATNSCVEGQDVINSVSDQEDAKGIRGQQQQIKSSRSEFENEEVLFDSPKKALIDKPESVGVLSNDKEQESITFVNPQDETVLSELSQPLDVEDRQAQSHLAQGRRLDALQDFKDKCVVTSLLENEIDYSRNPENSYVDCVGGFVRDISTGLPTSQTCAAACIGLCCTGTNVCDFFTGKVCRDGSCSSGSNACRDANIDYVVGPSCTGFDSCLIATIGSVDSSCKDDGSCKNADLIGVDLINSCKKEEACKGANGNEAFDELIDCCNDMDEQCEDEVGLEIFDVGCPAPTSMPSSAPSSSSAPSEVPSEVPSDEPSESPSISQEPSEVPSAVPSVEPSEVPSFLPTRVPSENPSEVPSDEPSTQPSQEPSESSEPSLAPSNSPRVTSVTVVEPNGVSKTVNCCESENDNIECQTLLAIAEAESLDECAAPSTSEQPSLVPSAVPSESGKPSTVPSFVPSSSAAPSVAPSANPSTVPTGSPSKVPSSGPSIGPTSAKAKTGKDYLREALASSIFSRYPWAPKASKSSMGKRVKTAKKNIKKALKTDNVFVKIRETSMASEVLGCGTPDTKTEEVCNPLSQAVLAFANSLSLN